MRAVSCGGFPSWIARPPSASQVETFPHNVFLGFRKKSNEMYYYVENLCPYWLFLELKVHILSVTSFLYKSLITLEYYLPEMQEEMDKSSMGQARVREYRG